MNVFEYCIIYIILFISQERDRCFRRNNKKFCLQRKKSRSLDREPSVLRLLHNGGDIVVEYRAGRRGSRFGGRAEKQDPQLLRLRVYRRLHHRDGAEDHRPRYHTAPRLVLARVLERYGRGGSDMRHGVIRLRYVRQLGRPEPLDYQVAASVASAQAA